MNTNYGILKNRNIKQNVRNFIIMGILAISIIIVFGIMLFNYKTTNKNVRSYILEMCRNSTEVDARNINRFFAEEREVLLIAAESLDFYLSQGDYEGEKIEELLRNISQSYNKRVYEPFAGVDFTGIYACVDGVLYHGFKDRSLLPAGYDPTQRQWYKEGLAGRGEVVFGEPYADIYDPDLTVMTVTKLLPDGRSVIGMNMTMDDLKAAAGEIGINIAINGETHDYGFGFLMTDKGIALVSGDDSYSDKDYSKPSHPMYPVYRQLADCTIPELTEETHYHELKYKDEDYCLFSRSLDNDWYYAILTNMEDIETSVYNFTETLLTGSITVLGIALLHYILLSLAYMESEKISKSLQGALDLASTDSLTGLLNRTAYDIRITQLQEEMAEGIDSSFAIIMLDLNDLKYINDHKGHSEGDRYICNSSELIRSIFPCEIYRIGGDEMALFLTGEMYDSWEIFYDKLKQAVEEANMSLVPTTDTPSIAIGVSLHIKGDKDDIEALLRKADATMYTNKLVIKQRRLDSSEKGYMPDVKKLVVEKHLLASELRRGLAEEQFEIWFQPQVNHANKGALIGVEALVRWRHPERGLVSPSVFIPMFEYNGLIYDLDKYVWRRVCAFVRRGLNDGLSEIPVSVNVSRYDMIQEDFIETIVSIVEEYNLPYEMVHLELTESAFNDDSGMVVETVKKLVALGFVIAIDDFGSGYSSLSLLRNVPAHIVKLDMRFFADGDNPGRNECIIESVIRMVKMLGMAVLAEGVEKYEQAEHLRTLGCSYIQGFLYSKPLTSKEFAAYIRASESEKVINNAVETLEIPDGESARSQKMFHNIISGTNDVVIVADNSTKELLYANRAAEHYFGKHFDPINPTTCMAFCDHRDLCKNCPGKNMKPNEVREHFTVEKGRHFKITFNQLDWNGRDAVVYYQTDISSQMQELEFSNALIRNIPGATFAFELDKAGRPQVCYVSEKAMKVFRLAGVTSEQLSFEDFLSVIHPDDYERAVNALNELFQDRISLREEFRVVSANGGMMWIDVLINPVADRDGSYLFYGIYNDITERKNTQEHMNSVLQSVPAAFTIYEITETSATRIFISDVAKEVLMVKGERDERKNVQSLYYRVHEKDRARVQTVTQDCFRSGIAFSIQFRLIGDKGMVRWMQLDSKPFKSRKEENTTLFYSIYTDINAQKQFEENAGVSDSESVIEHSINFCLQEATKLPTLELTVDYIVRFVGKALQGERTYIFEKNPDRTDSNTFEWVAEGITPEKENLQNVPEEICRPWYDEFKKENIVVIEALEDIRTENPELYEVLSAQNIQSLIVAPLFDNHGEPMGFFGIDNPPVELIRSNASLVQKIAFHIEASIKRRNLGKL